MKAGAAAALDTEQRACSEWSAHGVSEEVWKYGDEFPDFQIIVTIKCHY